MEIKVLLCNAKRSKGFSNKPKPSRILRHEEIVLGHEASAL